MASTFKWQGLLHPTTREFIDLNDERAFIQYSSKEMFPRVKSSLRTFNIFMILLLPISVSPIFTEDNYYPLPIHILLVICVFCTRKHIDLRHDLYESGTSIETVVTFLLTFSMSLWMLSIVPNTYGYPYDLVWDNESNQKDREHALDVWIVYTAGMALVPMVAILAYFLIDVIRYRMTQGFLGTILVVHALRSIVLTPFPPNSILIWSLVNYVGLPICMTVVLRGHETAKRERYLLIRTTRQSNESLKRRVNEMEIALNFEAPTDEETQVVTKVVREAGAELRVFEIPFNQLKFLHRVGAGAFGEVIKAEFGGATVAVKRLMRSHINERSLKMLMDEVHTLHDLRHPNIVQFVGVSWDSIANICLVLEFVERGSMQILLEDSGVALLWADPLLRMMADVVCGLAYLHGRPERIIHRDIKPDNVLVTPTFACKLADFGSARKLGGTPEMTQIGTSVYMAPEVICGYRYDEKVDVYALGIMMVALHARETPFKQLMLEGVSVFGSVVAGKRPAVPASMPGEIAELAKDCWCHDPDDRPCCSEVFERLKMIEMEGLQEDEANTTRSTIRGWAKNRDKSNASAGKIFEILTQSIDSRVQVNDPSVTY